MIALRRAVLGDPLGADHAEILRTPAASQGEEGIGGSGEEAGSNHHQDGR
jgi:hypothetical protein